MEDEIAHTTERWFHSTFLVLNESYQVELRRILSPSTYELVHVLSDFYMYDYISLFVHLLGLTSHYLTSTSFVYADNQLRHKLNLHLLLVARTGYERTSLVEHIKHAMNNVQTLRQTGTPFDGRSTSMSNIFCRSDDATQSAVGFCISDKFDEHKTSTHLQRYDTSSIMGTSNGHYVQQLLNIKFNNKKIQSNNNTDWLMVFIASKARLFCQRLKAFDPNRYPSLEQLIIVINCLCSNAIDFYFDEPQANQFLCDYLDGLSLKATSFEDSHPWMASRYLSAQEHVIRVSASLRIIEMAIETLIVYKRTFHTFGQTDKILFDNCIRIIEQTRGTTITKRIHINSAIVQSAIYFVNTSIKQFEIMFEPTISIGTSNSDHLSSLNQPATPEYPWLIRSSSPYPPQSMSPASKRLKTMVDPSYLKSLELAHELLLFPFVAFTRTSVYSNSKLKRNAAYLDCVIEELKKYQLIIIVRQGVQMVDGTRRRVDLIVKCAPILKDIDTNSNESRDVDLIERLNRFGVDYDRYIQTLGTLDIGEKYRLSEQCFDLLNSSDYKRYLTVDLDRIAPLHRIQQQEETNDVWNSSSSSSSSNNVKIETTEFHI
ncbi:unnamed protein product [Rotaria magnacalcarata]|uniref:Uncharacterized protein n=5 Tax=Rotaria magnacalcarata TaxID=392030 RepID=A0A816QQ60_9BILA|nr:unnamed protein product [Rotaria magnacalcarata]CAF3747880.1 unnamed protein product [Rotaria magnacalcarata]